MDAIVKSDVPFTLIFSIFAVVFFAAAGLNGYSHIDLWSDGIPAEATVLGSEKDRSGRRTNHWLQVSFPYGEDAFSTRLRTSEHIWEKAKRDGTIRVKYLPEEPDQLLTQKQLDHAASATIGTSAIGGFFALIAAGAALVRRRYDHREEDAA
jgi:hypothetical protein